MPNVDIPIPRANDRQVIDFFNKLAGLITIQDVNYHVYGFQSAIRKTQSPETIDRLRKEKLFNIKDASASINNLHISYQRTPEARALYDKVALNNNPQQGQINIEDSKILDVNVLISSIFKTEWLADAGLYGDPQAFSQIIASHQDIITRLEQSLADVGEEFARKRVELEREFDERKRVLDESNSDARRHLDAEAEEFRKEIHDEREKLNARSKELDDRDNTHARRALRNDLKSKLKEHAAAFTLTTKTVGLRRPIHLVVLVALIVLGAGVWFFAREAAAASSFNPVALAKSVGFSIAFLALLAWYIRWLNSWFQRHAEAEFNLKQFELDVDRASWVVETALEWRNIQDKTIPDHLLESISRNLFAGPEREDGGAMQPVDYLASALLGKASRARLNIGGNEIEFNRRALKAAGK